MKKYQDKDFRDISDRIKKLERAVNLPEQHGGYWDDPKSGDIRVVTGEDKKVYIEVKTRDGVYTTLSGALAPLNSIGRPDATNLNIEVTQIINVITGMLENLYEYYYWFTAISPSTLTQKIKIGFGTIGLAMNSGVIVVTSSGQFSADMMLTTSQGINYDRPDVNTINLYPPTDWGTLSVIIYKPKIPV